MYRTGNDLADRDRPATSQVAARNMFEALSSDFDFDGLAA
jgi:hypothetical protein